MIIFFSAQKAVNQVGIFQSQPLPTMTNIEAKKIENHCKQTGVVRTNCVDCLGKNTKKETSDWLTQII